MLDQGENRWGFLYFIHCCVPDFTSAVKIGHARNVASRMSTLQMGNPIQLELLASALVAGPDLVELQLHRRFRDDRLRGEWFRWSPDLGALIDRVARFEKRRVAAALAGKPLPALIPDLIVLGTTPEQRAAAESARQLLARARGE